MKAHYYATKKHKHVIISESYAPVGQKFSVSGKKEAREIAAKFNAQPHNF